MRVWDARTGAEIARLEGEFNAVKTVIFDADGRRILERVQRHVDEAGGGKPAQRPGGAVVRRFWRAG